MPILLQYIHATYLNLLNNKPLDIKQDNAYLDAQEYIQNTESSNNDYWNKQVGKIDEYLNLNHLISNKDINSLNNYRHIKQHKTKTLDIKDKLYDNLKALGKQNSITLNAILQYVWHKVLSIYGTNNSSNNITTIVGTTISGRDLPINNIESSIGLYINTLPLIVEHNSTDTILEAIAKLQDSITEMNIRSNTNLAKLQKDGNRLFDSLFVYENYPTPVNNNNDNTLNIAFKESIEKLDYPIAVTAYDNNNNQLSFSLKYAGEIFDSSTIDKLLTCVSTLLTQVSMLYIILYLLQII